jgi:ATP-dependent Lon protease
MNLEKKRTVDMDDHNEKRRYKKQRTSSPVKVKNKDSEDEEQEDIEETESESECEESDSDEELVLDNLESAVSGKKIKKEYLKIKDQIYKSEPNAFLLLKENLLTEDKADLCLQYELYKTCDPNTDEWLESRKKYNTMLKDSRLNYKQYIKFTKSQHKIMENELNKIQNYNSTTNMKYKILSLNTSIENKKIIYEKFEEFQMIDSSSDEYSKLNTWLKWAVSLPYNTYQESKVNKTNISIFIAKVKESLDNKLYGMEKVKEQILLFLTAKIMNPSMKKVNLGLVGPPGIGKTSIAKTIADVMEWGFEQISCGGIDKAEFLKGHDYTYVGSQPGEIVKSLKRMKHNNGIIFLDELEKGANNPDIKSALLHITDTSQNFEFKDNYMGEIVLDISNIWYIASMNDPPKDEALADRWWLINLEGYSSGDKVKIAKNYIMPKLLKNIALEKDSIKFDYEYIISKYCKDSEKGVRSLERILADLVNKVYFNRIHKNNCIKTSFDIESIEDSSIITNDNIDKLLKNINSNINVSVSMMYL